MALRFFKPLCGIWKTQTEDFLASLGLRFADNLDFTVLAIEDDKVIATGSRQGNILKCIGVSPDFQGDGLAASIVTVLVKEAFEENIRHLFLYTSPANIPLFETLGFFLIVHTGQVALLENKRNGAQNYVAGIRNSQEKGRIGCIVANCNPFTLGHQYLAEYAASKCDFVYFLVLSEDKSFFSTDVRYRLAQEGLKHLSNVAVHLTGSYLVSQATFPDYFIKDRVNIAGAYYDLDIAVFLEQFAKPLNIIARFVGTEPCDMTTNGYNQRMKELLPAGHVRLEEVPRIEAAHELISASTVRKLMQQGDLESIKKYVPKVTLDYIAEVMKRGL